jgi:hypothetical protein
VRAFEGVVGAATATLRAHDGKTERPIYTAIPIVSVYAAFQVAVSITMALNARQRSGLGQRIEVPLFDSMFPSIDSRGLHVHDAAKVVPSRAGIWGGNFECADGRWVQYGSGNQNFRAFVEATRPWSDGTTGIKLSPVELLEKLAAIVLLPRAYLVRYAGCLAPHSTLRAALIPTPRQQGVDGEASKIATSSWHWARLLGRVFDLDMATCPLYRRGSLRISAAILPPLRGRREPCDLHAGISDYAYFAPSPADLRPTAHCPCTTPPRDLCLRRRPRQREPVGEGRAAAASCALLRLATPV